MSWEDEEPEGRWTRRDWVKAGMGIGAVGALTALGASAAGQLLPPPIKASGEVSDEIHYTKFPTPQWWNDRAGSPMTVTDFPEWRGATGTWRGLFRDGKHLAGTGYPVLVIRVKRDDEAFSGPSQDEIELPDGFDLYYDDENRDIRIVVCFDRCVHLCCYPGWQVIRDPPPEYRYLAPALTYEKYGLDPIYCVCHGSQYDPLVLVKNVNPKNEVEYVGARHVHGPADRALPVVPVRAERDVLVGGMPDPRWYEYC